MVKRKKRTKEGRTLVWKDETGTYKLGYSQYLQRKMLQINVLLLVCFVVLIIMLVIGFIYADSLIQRIDKLDIFSKAVSFLYL